MLPDLINFDEPSTSVFDISMSRDDNSNSESLSINSSVSETSKSISLSRHSEVEHKTKTEDSYIFEASYLLNLAARSEENEDYQRAFDYYKSGIEKLLIGVQSKLIKFILLISGNIHQVMKFLKGNLSVRAFTVESFSNRTKFFVAYSIQFDAHIKAVVKKYARHFVGSHIGFAFFL